MARLQQPGGLDASSSPASVMEQALANAAWALAKQGYDDRRVVVSFLQQAWDKLLEVDSAHVAGTMWALANLHLEDPRFIHQLLHHIRPRLWACTPQALANTAVAVARSKHHDSTFVQLLLLHCRSKLSLFSPGLLCSLAWALAVLNHSDAGFVDSLVQQLLRDPSKLERQQLCVLLWSLSILEHDTTAASPPLVAAACRELLQPCSPGSTERPATAEQLRLVHQFVATLESEGAVGADLWAQPQYQQLRALCQAAWVEDVRQASPTHMHQELLVAARQVPGCSNAQALQLTDDGLLRVDLALRLPSGVNVRGLGHGRWGSETCTRVSLNTRNRHG